MSSSIVTSFVAAIQASLSVLLVISYGAIAAHLRLLDSKNGKAISKICVKMFLPALLLVKLGSEIHPGSAHRYLIILIWAFFAHAVSFLIGISAHWAFGMPDWITCAIMFNNTTSYPLLLIESLDETGILEGLMVGNESTRAMIERAKSYFLVFSTVSACLTFAVGPRLIDTEHAPESDDEDMGSSSQATLVSQDADDEEDLEEGPILPNERSLLLDPEEARRVRNDELHLSVHSITFFPSKPTFRTVKRRPHFFSLPKWSSFSPRMKWWLLFFYDFLNAPLIGAALGAIIGLAPPLHRAFFGATYEGGIFKSWLTQSWKNVGQLFVPLPLIVAGISLYTAHQEKRRSPGGGQETRTPVLTTMFIMVVRFLVWPALSISLIYAIVKNQGQSGLLGNDPMLWFTMMLMPTGPSAMKLITMIQVSNAGVEEERRIASILTVSYVVSPVLAFTVVGALKATQAAI